MKRVTPIGANVALMTGCPELARRPDLPPSERTHRRDERDRRGAAGAELRATRFGRDRHQPR
jgi:hypothetical protein